MGTIVGQAVTKEFMFKLTQAETADKGLEMARLDGEIMDLEKEFSKVQAAHRAQVKDREVRRHELSAVVREGVEKRMCEATMAKDFSQRLVQYYLEGRLIEERSMTEEECQMELDMIAQQTETKSAKEARAVKLVKGGKARPKKVEPENELDDHIRKETNRRTKRSAVDGAYDK